MLTRLSPMLEDEGQGGGAQAPTFEVNGQQMTAEQLVDAYKKLQTDHTKVTQKNSEMSKDQDKVKPWLDWDKSLDDLSTKTGINVKALAGTHMENLINNLAAGKAPTATQMNNLDKEINKAEDKGDTKTAAQLEALQAVVMEREFEKAMDDIEKSAQSDDIAFNRKEFEEFADKWLEDLDIGEDDDFDLKLLNKAYQAYEAKKIKEQAKGGIPQLGTSGASSSPSAQKQGEKVGGLRGAAQKAAAMLNGR